MSHSTDNESSQFFNLRIKEYDLEKYCELNFLSVLRGMGGNLPYLSSTFQTLDNF